MPTKTRINGENYTQLPRLVSDDIIMKGLPNTPGAPAGYGDLASAVNAASGDNGVKTVTPVNYQDVRMYTEYNGTMYGVSSSTSNQLLAISKDLNISNFGSPLPEVNVTNIKFISDNRLIAVAGGAGNLFKFYLSPDGGSTWQMVYDNVIQDARTLTDRSICVAEINGATVLLYGQYNINGSRTPGSTNDAVKLLRSDDLGQTWSVVTEWNTDGSTRNVRHIHCVKQDPISKRIYVATGDSNSESCIYSWDGVSAWPSNVSPENTTQTSGLKAIFGAQRFRAVDILFRGDHMYWMPDTNAGVTGYAPEVGIWKIRTDYSSVAEKVSSAGANLAGNAGWLCVELSDGTAYFCTGVDSPVAGFSHSAIIASNEDLTQWKPVGATRATNLGQPIPFGFCVIDDVVYHSIFSGSGKGAETTVAFVKSQHDFRGDLSTVYELDTLHPVFWVSPASGSNANDGWRPSTAFETVNYAVTGDRATYGARVQIPAGEYAYTGPTIAPKFNANARGGDITEPCYIYGSGASSTYLVFKASATATIGFSLAINGNASRLGVKSMTCYTEKDMRLAYVAGSANSFYISQSIFGNSNFPTPSGIVRGEDGAIYSYSSIISSFTDALVSATSGATSFSFFGDKALIFAGNDAIKISTTSASHAISGVDLSFYGFSSNAIETTAGDFSSFYLKRAKFASVLTSAAALAGSSTGWNGKLFDCKSSVPIGVSAAVFGDLEPCTNAITETFSEYVD